MKRTIYVALFLTLIGGSALWGAYTWYTSLNLDSGTVYNPFTRTYQYPNFQAESTSQASNGLIGGYLMYNYYPYFHPAVNMTLSGSLGIFSEYLGANFPNTGDTAPTGNFVEVDANLYSNQVIAYYGNTTSKTQFASASFTSHSGVAIKSIWDGAAGDPVLVYVDNALVLSAPSTAGASGNGTGIGVTSGGGVITHVDIGPWDGVAPHAVPSTSIGASLFTNHIDLSWPAATDDTNGMGIAEYQVYRGGILLGSTTGLTYSDTTVVPDTTYSYDLRVRDDFFNLADTAFSERTPVINSNAPYPLSNPEGRRVGVRSTGAYWGASPENIDVRSGNLSFAIPVLTAQSRAGLSASFNLSYNSQNWRNYSGSDWNFDGDVGYGFGWRLLAGSITPVWNPGGLTAAYFLFMDSTGAEYRLDQPSGNVWSSKDSIYVYFDANTNILHFRNGSSWYFGDISAAGEADAGVMYPTLMQDTHTGNQITIAYKQSSGAGWINSSARIATITDVRTTSPTYSFTYNTDSPPHLTSITSAVGDGMGLTATYLTGQTLTASFDGVSFPTTAFANTFTTIGGTFSLTHNGSGELTRIGLPYGGYLAYDYATATYSSGYSYREITNRYLSKDGSTQTTYAFSHEPTLGPDAHAYTILDDPGGVGEKYWAFATSGTYEGLTTQYQGRQLPGPVTLTQNDFTWAQDAASNSYISSTLTTADPGQTYQAQKQTTQTVDTYGNVTQVQNFDWNNLTTFAKTYTYTYLTGTGTHTYITDYVMNRMLTAKVTDGTYLLTLATNAYDGGSANYGPGNMTSSTTLAGTSWASYDSYGNMQASTNPQGVITGATYNAITNFAAPTQFTVGSLTETIAYSPFLAPTSNTGPNTDTTSITYLNAAKPSTTTSAYNLITNYSYPTPNTTAAVVNGRWSRTTLDGLGRTIMVENGTGTTVGSGIVNEVDTTYDSCGCSPLGKLKSTSLPHAHGAGPVSTTYTYDGIGRTLSVLAPDGASTTTYSYQGNAVTVTDPAGAWKKYTSDAFGRLTRVEEPNPAGGSYITTYTYDELDHLTQVNMARPTGTQTRMFNYIDPATSKPGALLRSATNPENGTVTYTYDSSNRLSTVLDAKNQKKVMTYDSLSRVIQVQRYVYSGTAYVEDTMERTTYSYDTNPYNGTYSTHAAGRLAAVQYYGGNCSSYVPSGSRSGCDLIQEWYAYNAPGVMTGKKLVLTRSPVSGSLSATFTVDNEGRPTSVTYPSWGSTPGSSYTYSYDTMGRINTMTDTVNTHTLISGMTYGVANEVQQMTSGYTTGVNTENRAYNGMFQLTQLTVGSALNIQYAYSATQNNGKITSQLDLISGEQVVYTYDALNRLASAQTAPNPSVTQWGQSYTYDGFGNLTDQTKTLGSAPDVHVAYNYVNNLQAGDTADFNGNIGAGYVYDIENRLVQPPSGLATHYAYDPSNKRVWRSDNVGAVDEIVFWAGQKLATYQISTAGGLGFTLTSTNVYFGGKLISKGTYNFAGTGDKVSLTPVAADRLGSIGKFYPFGTERPSATANDTEKFTGYFRDASTGLDYADQRYHQSGVGRFMTPDLFSGSAKPGDPGSWNRYAYVGGDPVNRTDPSGQDDACGAWDYASACPEGSDIGWCLSTCQVFGNIFGGVFSTSGSGTPGIGTPSIGDCGGSNQTAFTPGPTSICGDPSPFLLVGSDPCPGIAQQIWNTITGVGMPGEKSLFTRIKQQIFGKQSEYVNHDIQIQNYRRKLQKLKDAWKNNNCDDPDDPPYSTNELIAATDPAKLKQLFDDYQNYLRDVALIGAGLTWVAYQAEELMGSIQVFLEEVAPIVP